MPVDKSDLEAIKAAIVAAISGAGGVADPVTTDPDAVKRYKKQTEAIIEQQKSLNGLIEAQQKISNQELREQKLRETRMQQTRLRIDLLQKEILQERAKTDANKETIASKMEQISAEEEELKNQKENLTAGEKKIQQLEKLKEAYNTLGMKMAGVTEVYGKHSTLNVQSAVSMVQQIKKAGVAGTAMGILGGGITGVVNTLIQFVIMIDESSSALMKQTGISRENALAMFENSSEMIKYGVTLEDTTKAFAALQPAFTDFTRMSDTQRQSVLKTVSMLEKHGMSLADLGKGLQVATKSFGMSTEEATGSLRELSSLAQAIGVAPQQMGADFAASADHLSKLGGDGVEAFKRLAITSKATGLEMEKLLRITEKFDTFEGAANQAGMLNAALGGNFVNAMDLMMSTDPADRFNQIRDAILNTGVSFDDMSYYQRKFYAEAAGLENTSDLALLMSGSLDELTASAQMTTADIEKLEERNRDFMGLQEKFKTLMMSLVPELTDVVKSLHEMFDQFKTGQGPLVELKDAMMGFVNALMLVGQHIEKVVIAVSVMVVGGLILKLAAAFKILTGASAAAAAPLASSALQLLAFGAAAALIGLGVGLAAVGIGYMAQSFTGLGEAGLPAAIAIGVFTLAMAGLIYSLATMSPVAAAAAVGLAPFGGAILLIGGGIALAAAGIGYMAEGFAKMFDAIDVSKLVALAKFMADAGGLGAIGNVSGAAGLAAMALGIVAIGKALESIPSTAIEMLNSLGSIEINASIAPLKANIEGIMNSIDGVSVAKLATTALIVTGASAAAAAPRAAVAAAPQAAAAQQNNIEVYVTLDSEPIATKTVEVIDKQFGESLRR